MPRISPRKRPAPAASLLKHLAAIAVVLIVAGCSGGGCGGGCSSCGGFTPLAGGFDVNHRIENAGSVRITRSGLDFLQSNLGTLAKGLLGGTGTGGMLTFAIPKTVGTGYTLCPNGSNPNANPKICTAEIDVANANLKIDPYSPNDLHITGTMPLRVSDLQINALGCDVDIAINGNNTCPGGNFDPFPLDVDIVIHVDQNSNHTARFGYSRVEIPKIIDANTAKSNLNQDLHICGGGFLCGTLLGGILNLVKGPIVDALFPQIEATLKDQIDSQLCQKPNPMVSPSCPTGTSDMGGVCKYADNTCASIILGTDGHINLGALLASVSPGTKGGLDILFAAGGPSKNDTDPAMKLSWGDLDPLPVNASGKGAGGVTLGMFGGAEPSPLSKCVKMSNIPLPTGIPIPAELFGETVPNWPATLAGPHLGLAVSERFANYAMNGIYNSGLLCIGISTENIPLLSSGTLGLLSPSSKDLGLQREGPQQVAIVIRPANPPSVAFGNGTDLATDPLIRVGLKQASIDFYFFSLDRFIRFMTATFDLDVPVNLSVGPDGLTPQIDKIGVSNGKITNSQLIREKPDALAASLGDLIGSLVGQQLGGALKPIDLNASLASLGIELIIPDTVAGKGSPGLRKLTKVNDNYLGIFAAFGLPMGPVPPGEPDFGVPPGEPGFLVARRIQSETSVQVTRKTVDPAGLKFGTLTPDNMPTVRLLAASDLDDGTRGVEFSYKIDDGFWHPYSSARFIDVRDPWMRVQGRHVIHVRSRVVGDSNSVDPTPAEVEVIIDAEPPTIQVGEVEGGKVALTVQDRLTPDAMVRFKLDKGAWSDWTLASRVKSVDVGEAAEIAVEARDSEGNVATASEELIRGRLDGPVAAGCGCTVVGQPQAPRGLWLLAVALGGVGARLFRRRSASTPVDNTRAALRAGAPAPAPRSASAPPVKRALRGTLGVVGALALAGSWAGCSCGSDTQSMTGGTTGGGYECKDPCLSLKEGLIGEYTSAAVSGKDIWVSGYAEGNWIDGDFTYGDLVVGKWDGKKVAWEAIDGVPSKPPVDPLQFDIKGFRGGQSEPGDDVGLWTSMAIGGDGHPAIAYYDRTHKALKFAQFDGKKWSAQTVETKPGADIGRYAKMVALGGGFTIAYQTIEPGGMGGALISKVRVATSAGKTPAAGTWTFDDAVVSDTTPCRASFCAATEACVASTKQCKAVDAAGCMPSCASTEACVAGKCAAVIDSNRVDSYPDAVGDYISIAPDGQGGVGIAFYDRTNGNLGIASKNGAKWTTAIVDGEGMTGNATGDSGIGASLFIDQGGDWHLTYVNGFTEALQYVKVTKGTMIGTPEIVDDGLGIAGTPFDDGQHLVGDDSHVVVMSGGEIHVTYQDATAGTLHYAVGAPGATGHTWTVKAITQDGFAGAFSNIVVEGGTLQLVNWWRVGGAEVKGDVRILKP
jgi:hypothetical protein